MSDKNLCNCLVYEWKESNFLENTKVILGLAGICGVHKILRKKGNPLYIVPESYYLECKEKLESNSISKDTL